MTTFTHILTYIILFISLNFEVFLLITYFENRKDIHNENNGFDRTLKRYPTVTIIVPCWNEEKTVSKTLHSLLHLDYPKDKLKVMVVDDGSTDNTWNVVQKFKNNPQIALYSKENGGKYTALNFGLSKTTSELVGCLDADSYVHKDALRHIVPYFDDKEIMAVAPSVKLWKPKGILQLLQKVEYGFGIFTRKMFHYMQAVYITPGPFSIFRREVFEKLGTYRHAHNTEDIEIALRIQKNGYKIAHAHNALVYTVAPHKLKPLLKQRVRWSYGFIKNAADYRGMFFNKQYGNLGVFVLPMAAISVGSIISSAFISVYAFGKNVAEEYVRIKTVGLHFSWGHMFDLFYIDTNILSFMMFMTFVGTVAMIFVSRKMADGTLKPGFDLLYYFALYIFIAPVWIAKALYNALLGVRASWR